MTKKNNNLNDNDVLEDMIKLPVTELVPQNCQNFVFTAPFSSFITFFLKKSIEQNNPLVFEKPIEICIAMGRPLTPFYNVQLCQRKVYAGSKIFYLGSQFPVRQRCVLVKQRGNQVWVDCHEEKHNPHTKQPQVQKEVLATDLKW